MTATAAPPNPLSRKAAIQSELARIGLLAKLRRSTRRHMEELKAELAAIEASERDGPTDAQQSHYSPSDGSGATSLPPSGPNGPGSRVATIYAIPPNQRMRLIEFGENDYGVLVGFRPTTRLRPGWRVAVEPTEEPGRWRFIKEWP